MRDSQPDLFDSDKPQTLAPPSAAWLAKEIFDPNKWDEPLKTVVREQKIYGAMSGAVHELALVKGKLKPQGKRPARRKAHTTVEDDPYKEVRLKIPKQAADAIEATIEESMKQPWWNTINQSVATDIENAIADGILNGDSGWAIAKEIQRRIGSTSARAQNIARTESTGALNAGAYAVRQDLASQGLIKGSEWLAIIDNDTRESHAALNGVQVNMDQPFNVGGEAAMFPGDDSLSPGERCSCRCVSVSVTISDEFNPVSDGGKDGGLLSEIAKE